MLNSDSHEKGNQINRSNQQKANLHVQHTFFVQAFAVLHDTLLFCMTKTYNFLVTHYFYGGIAVFAHQKFCCLCSYSIFFTPVHFHLAGCRHFSCLSQPLSNFCVFLPMKFVSFVLNHSHQPYIGMPMMWKDSHTDIRPRDYQNFPNGWITKFFQVKGLCSRVRSGEHGGCLSDTHPLKVNFKCC